jgi:hypothetical protein
MVGGSGLGQWRSSSFFLRAVSVLTLKRKLDASIYLAGAGHPH